MSKVETSTVFGLFRNMLAKLSDLQATKGENKETKPNLDEKKPCKSSLELNIVNQKIGKSKKKNLYYVLSNLVPLGAAPRLAGT